MTDNNNFIEEIISEDVKNGKHDKIITRFPPEPNGYLHIGHAKAVCINFGVKEKFNGECNLRFDDTNPSKEDNEYVEAIKKDIEWLGFKWDRVLFASDYFDEMYNRAKILINKGLAYVCELSADEIKLSRGTLTEPGKESPYRNRSVSENLELFEKMKNGEFADGSKVLRAKIDMASPNINMRDPVIYRILRATHHRTGDKWVIYPMYDFAHPIEDALEGVTHSLCSLEFEDHRPLYDWVTLNCGFESRPRQIEFARLNLTCTVMSKRYLKKLVDEKVVYGWDDVRMPTLSGLRKRGVPPEVLRDFCERIGVAKSNSECEIAYFDACIREYLNANAERAMAVFDPLKVTITNYNGEEDVDFEINQMKENAGLRKIKFGKEIYIDRSDFELNPPPKYFRLKKDGYVRLKGAYIIKCDEVILNDDGSVKELKCSYVENSRSGSDNSGIKVKGVIQWVNADYAKKVTVKQYKRLLKEAEFAGQDFSERMEENTETVFSALVEPYVVESQDESRFQLMRLGYYKKYTEKGETVLSEIVSLKDNFNK